MAAVVFWVNTDMLTLPVSRHLTLLMLRSGRSRITLSSFQQMPMGPLNFRYKVYTYLVRFIAQQRRSCSNMRHCRVDRILIKHNTSASGLIRTRKISWELLLNYGRSVHHVWWLLFTAAWQISSWYLVAKFFSYIIVPYFSIKVFWGFSYYSLAYSQSYLEHFGRAS